MSGALRPVTAVRARTTVIVHINSVFAREAARERAQADKELGERNAVGTASDALAANLVAVHPDTSSARSIAPGGGWTAVLCAQ